MSILICTAGKELPGSCYYIFPNLEIKKSKLPYNFFYLEDANYFMLAAYCVQSRLIGLFFSTSAFIQSLTTSNQPWKIQKPSLFQTGLGLVSRDNGGARRLGKRPPPKPSPSSLINQKRAAPEKVPTPNSCPCNHFFAVAASRRTTLCESRLEHPTVFFLPSLPSTKRWTTKRRRARIGPAVWVQERHNRTWQPPNLFFHQQVVYRLSTSYPRELAA
ncbi:hypothetical protein VTO42DRAFT_996 [Malbranchea cinnamomea]